MIYAIKTKVYATPNDPRGEDYQYKVMLTLGDRRVSHSRFHSAVRGGDTPIQLGNLLWASQSGTGYSTKEEAEIAQQEMLESCPLGSVVPFVTWGAELPKPEGMGAAVTLREIIFPEDAATTADKAAAAQELLKPELVS